MPAPSPCTLEPDPLEKLLARVRKTRFGGGLACPRCGSRHVHRWGGFSGRRRYRCRGGCGRTFSDLTGTPAAYIKKLDRWLAYGTGMLEGESLRAAARRLHLHPSTAFRWRHRLLQGLQAGDREELVGWVELAMRRVLRSRKGERPGPGRRPWNRPPRHRTLPWLWPAGQVAGVVVACDRRGHAVTGVVDAPVARDVELERILGGRIRGPSATEPPVVVAQPGPLAPPARFARSQAALYRSLQGRGHLPSDPLLHVRTATAYGVRWHRWMRRFRGVATKYLPHYLIWHRRLDRAHPRDFLAALLRWPLAHGFR
jgi:transposase-like protein